VKKLSGLDNTINNIAACHTSNDPINGGGFLSKKKEKESNL